MMSASTLPPIPSRGKHNSLTVRITGIVDWADARIALFGTSLGGLETILGVRTSSYWYFHPSHNEPSTRLLEIFQ
jgi:hypothetical protein